MSNFYCQGCATVLHSRIDYGSIEGLPYCAVCYQERISKHHRLTPTKKLLEDLMPCLCIKCHAPCDCNELHCGRCLADAMKEEEAKAGQPAADVSH